MEAYQEALLAPKADWTKDLAPRLFMAVPSRSLKPMRLTSRRSSLLQREKNIVLQPTIGISYNQFNDDGYTQSGTVVPQTVAARKSYNCEGVLGGKVLGIFNYNDYIIKPNASAYAHITIKDKQGKIHTSLDATTGQVPLDQSKASAAWYSAGTGLFVTKGPWEAGVSYELQLDKKYVGHQGTLRLRVEF